MNLWILNFVIAAISFATFIWGVKAVFRKVAEKEPRGMTVIKAVASIVMVAFLVSLYQAPTTKPWLSVTGFLLLCLSNLLFWLAVKENRKKPLSLAYSPD